jgi:ceramide glucosyltransferase
MELFWIFAAISGLGLVGYAMQILAIRRHLAGQENRQGSQAAHRDPDSSASREFTGPISVLKPLKGLDDNLFDNLESFCLQDYPQYEIIFCLQDRNDPARKVAAKVQERHPDRDISIVVEDCQIGLNPKVNNLLPAYRRAKHPYILISDSNVRVGPDYLRAVIEPMRNPAVGLVSNPIRGVGGRSLGAIFENLHLNSFIMGSICFLDRFLRMPCVVGKSMLMRRIDLEAAGGLFAVRNVLAEDYVLGRKIHSMGLKVVLSEYPIDNVNYYWSLRRFVNRHTRWGKMRWCIGGFRYLFELLSNSVFVSWLSLLFWGPTSCTVALAGGVSVIKIAGDYLLARRISAGIPSWHFLFSPLKDLLVGILWFAPLLSRSVTWRGNRFRIGPDSLLEPWRGRPLAQGLHGFPDVQRSPAVCEGRAPVGSLQ